MNIAPSVAETLSETSSDAVLIEAARKYNKAVEGHSRAVKHRMMRLMEDFWKLGETLSFLYKRHNPTKTWMACLKEIGVNPTTAGHAKKFFERTAFENLDTWKCKTEALRDLGILVPPADERKLTLVVSETPDDEAPVRPREIEDPRERPELGGVRPDALEKAMVAPVGAISVADAAPTPSIHPLVPTSRERLFKVVRTLEEIGPVEADSVDLLDRAAALIEGLRAAARKEVA